MKALITKLFESKLDERQTLEFLKSRKTALWIAYVMLLLSIIIQSWILGSSISYYAGELIIFMVVGIYIIISDIRRGEWSDVSNMKPGIRSYLLWASGSSAAFSVIYGIITYVRYQETEGMKALLPATGIFFIFIFLLSFGMLALVGTLTKKRRKKLDENSWNDEE